MKLYRVTIAAAALLATTAFAHAAPRHHHHRHHHHRVAHHHHHVPAPQVAEGWNIFHSDANGNGLVSKARRYLGETAGQVGVRRSLWCAAFMNKILGGGTGSDEAKSYLQYRHVAPKIGAIAVTRRRGGGHVGVVSGFDANGNPIIISGNHGHKVGEGVYSKRSVIAYVDPNS